MNIIQQPELLRIQGAHGITWGGNQIWYTKPWQRQAGCGPTTSSNLVWYLSKTQERFQQLWPYKNYNRANMIKLMEELWSYITPGMMGVNNTSIFIDGAVEFGKSRGIELLPEVLDIPLTKKLRPEYHEVKDFLHSAFSNNLPVAFLNLNNGSLRNLESWHWVTLISANEDLKAEMIDQGNRIEIDLKKWLDTTKMGGGFVVLK